MSVTLTAITAGRRLNLNTQRQYGMLDLTPELQKSCGFKGDWKSVVISPVGSVAIWPVDTKLIVTAVNMLNGTMSGVLFTRDGAVRAGYTQGLKPEDFDGIRGACRLPGEPKPGGEVESKQDTRDPGKPDHKPLPSELQAHLGGTCPVCQKGTLVEKVGRYGAFVGCDRYPACSYIANKSMTPEQAMEKYGKQQQQQQQQQPEGFGDEPSHEEQQEQPQPEMPQPQGDEASAEAMALAALVKHIGGKGIDEATVRRIAAEEAEKRAGKGGSKTHIKINAMPEIALDGVQHKQLPELVRRLAMKNRKGMRFAQLLVGEAGTGKSTLCEQAATVLGLRFAYVNCSGGMSESRLIGRMTPNLTTGEEKYTATPFVEFYQHGGVFLLDEGDAADANVLLTLNGMMEATHWTAPNGETLQRHPDFCLLMACNTYGTGADRKYTGRNQLDAAFLNRWLTLTISYDEQLEEQLTATEGLAKRFQSARRKMQELNMRRWLTPRDIERADVLVQQAGYKLDEAVVAATDSWTDDERRKVGLVAA
jgi:hypothetical protein